jgi:hypothetical protein
MSDMLTELTVTVLGSAPATIALLYLIYRQEAKETRILDALLNIAMECYRVRQREQETEALRVESRPNG